MQKAIDANNTGPGKRDGVSVKQLLFSRQGYFVLPNDNAPCERKSFIYRVLAPV
ncbi:MAG: hypothetical protein WB586_18865 [Chthoniobacterales bacterium]